MSSDQQWNIDVPLDTAASSQYACLETKERADDWMEKGETEEGESWREGSDTAPSSSAGDILLQGPTWKTWSFQHAGQMTGENSGAPLLGHQKPHWSSEMKILHVYVHEVLWWIGLLSHQMNCPGVGLRPTSLRVFDLSHQVMKLSNGTWGWVDGFMFLLHLRLFQITE